MKNRLLLFIPVAIFGVLGILFWRGLSLDPTYMPSALVGNPIPDFQLPTLQEPVQSVTQEQLKGQVVLLNVWATWCITCRQEHPYLLELARQGVPIYGINYKDDNAKALKWLDDLGNPYVLNVVDADGRLGLDLGVFGAPETYLVDKQGIIRYKQVGMVDDKVWKETLQPLFQQYQ